MSIRDTNCPIFCFLAMQSAMYIVREYSNHTFEDTYEKFEDILVLNGS